jgi:hypothetical protein
LHAPELNDIAADKSARLSGQEPLLIDERAPRTIQVANRELRATRRKRSLPSRHLPRRVAFLVDQVEPARTIQGIAHNHLAGLERVLPPGLAAPNHL